MAGCGSCGAAVFVVAGAVGRRDLCDQCGAELRSCLSCRHYEPGVAKGCKEPQAEVPRERDRANFCEFFQIGDGARHGGGDTKSALESAAEALFKKP